MNVSRKKNLRTFATSYIKPHGISRVISKRGFCSRSKAVALIHEGRVKLKGKIITNPETPTFEEDEILIDEKPVIANKFIYFMMNKPRGYVTTTCDEKGRATVMDLFCEQYAKLFPNKQMPHISPVGRLDAASEGVLLFTNNTEWANKILEPTDNHLHKKIYRVQVSGQPSAKDLEQMETGFNVPPRVFGEHEEFMHAVSAKIHSKSEKNCWLEITLDEGKNREIRRMLAHLNYNVMRLVRIKFCDYELGLLKPGCIQEISVNH